MIKPGNTATFLLKYMEACPLKFIVEACNGKLLRGSGETLVRRVCTDSRQAQPGDVFFAIKGDKFDGHDFIEEVAKKGVVAVVVAHSQTKFVTPNETECAVIAVDWPRLALGIFSAAYRAEFDLPVIAVGGSNGKTTTKELIAAVLRQKLNTLWSEASFNNDIGVPLTLLRLEKSHQAAVLEVGTNHPGEMPPLLMMIRPKFAVITNIGREHLEFFGNAAGVAEEEGWLAELLPSEGKLFLNGDDEWSLRIADRTRAGVVRVGLNAGNLWRAVEVRLSRQGATFRVAAPDPAWSGEYKINLLGRHQIVNALFAVAVGAELGLSREEIQRGLAECQPANMRLQISDAHGVTILDDTYNANADSMLAALSVLKDLPGNGRRLAVLGDMAELGAQSESAHAEVGRRAAELGVGQLFAVGKMAGVMGNAAREAGLARVVEFAEVEAAASAMKSFVKPGDVVLLKASRATHLERVAEALRGETSGK